MPYGPVLVVNRFTSVVDLRELPFRALLLGSGCDSLHKLPSGLLFGANRFIDMRGMRRWEVRR